MSNDFDDRQLCPDGGCIGLIGPDGRCKECGRVAPNWGDERNRGLRTEEEIAPEIEVAKVRGSLETEPDDFDERELCPDEGCIGVIGANGRCNECGKRGASPASN